MDGAFICRSRSLCHLDVPPWGDFNFLRWEPGHAVAAHDHPFLQAIHPATKAMDVKAATAGLPVPLHPGAARYYKEVGVAIPAHLMAK